MKDAVLYKIPLATFTRHKENGGHSLLIMSCPKQISQSMFDAFNQYLKNKVMKNVFM